MKIIDLTEEHKQLYFECLEDWSDEIKEAGSHKACWYAKMKDKGLGVKLALDDQDTVGGMIQYVPIEYSPAEGKNLYFIPCIWVHGYKKGRGNFQKKGMGRALLRSAEEDVQRRGAGGLVAWGVSMPFWMRASWYKKQGYQKVDTLKGAVLLWKPFNQDAVQPQWIRPKKKPRGESGKVIVTAFHNGCCPAQGMVYERARRAVSEFGNKVEFRGVDTFDRAVFLEWGINDGLFIDDREIRTGPPPSYKKIKKHIGQRVKKLS
jgi:GNAT superfamily N-acetyltransferase